MKKTLFILFATFVSALSSIAADEYTWQKVTANQTDWSGTYLIANTNFGGIFDGSKTENTGLTGSANAIDGSTIIKGDEFTTTTTANAFTFAKMEGGYSVQAASGEYIYNKNGGNSLFVSDDPIALTISWESNTPMISAQDNTVLQAASSSTTMFGRFRFYNVTKSPITLYKLQEATTEKHSITITENEGTIHITPDDNNVNYAYYVLNSTEYNKHLIAGRNTANKIFDAQVPLLETSELHQGETTIQVSELLPEGDWYIVAACVKGEDNGNFVEYSRYSDGEASQLLVNNVPFVGCKWNKGTAPWAGTYLLVAEDTEACLNGSLSGDPTTGALQSTGNMKGSTIFDGEIETSDKAMSFTIEAMEGGYSIKSASGWYIGGFADKNGITTSQTPLLNTIADDGTITSEGHILSLALGKIMYRDAASEKVVPYVLTLDTTTEPVDYSKANYTIAIDQEAQTALVSSDMEEARFGYIILTAKEYDTHVENSRTTANEIFDVESALLRGTEVKTAPYTINLSELAEGSYYIVVAGVEAEDQGFRTVYHRISQAVGMEYSNEPSEVNHFTVVENGNNTVTVTPDNNTEYWYATFVPAAEVGEFDEESMIASLVGKFANAVINIFEESDAYVGEKILSTAELAEGDYKLVVGYIEYDFGMFFPGETFEYYDITVKEPVAYVTEGQVGFLNGETQKYLGYDANNVAACKDTYNACTIAPWGTTGLYTVAPARVDSEGKWASGNPNYLHIGSNGRWSGNGDPVSDTNNVLYFYEIDDVTATEWTVTRTEGVAYGHSYLFVAAKSGKDYAMSSTIYSSDKDQRLDGVEVDVNGTITANQAILWTAMNDDTTGVGTVLAPQTTTGMFNLQGQRINANQRGLMIQNGKKVLR